MHFVSASAHVFIFFLYYSLYDYGSAKICALTEGMKCPWGANCHRMVDISMHSHGNRGNEESQPPEIRKRIYEV